MSTSRRTGEIPPGTIVDRIPPGGRYMPFDQPVYTALDCPAWVSGKEVLLAVERNKDPTQRKVIAMFPDEARYLHSQGRLLGWEPGA